ncbi:ROK family protein [Nonomuraea sp. NPDC050536]|uniref:ROK family transcriptional regulator n=1 Tax=Nonomuraea sp. NPDC050536 TaxID=3364366 RepID=UPI0037CBD47C
MENSDARRANRAAVLGTLLGHGPASRVRLAQLTSLSKATVSRVTDALLAEGLIREAGPVAAGGPGRQPYSLEVTAGAGLAAGVDIGGTSTRFLVTDLAGRVVRRHREPTPTQAGAAELAAWLTGRLTEFTGERLLSAVVGLPGAVHPGTGAVRTAPNLPQIAGTAFTQAVDGPVTFDNDANCALLGEVHAGAAAGRRTAVMLTIGTGLGASVFLNGAPLPGRTGAVGEFGTLPYGQGTLEDAIAGVGLSRAAAELGLTIEDVFVTEALSPVRESARRALAVALQAVTIAYEPEVIVLGGGISPSLEPWCAGLRAGLAEVTPEPPEVVTSALGDPAGAIGALVAALQKAYEVIGAGAVQPPIANLLTTEESGVS